MRLVPDAGMYDDSAGDMHALFAPFQDATFPKSLDAASVAALMAVPLACRDPVPPLQLAYATSLFPDPFCLEATTSAFQPLPFHIRALQATWPEGNPTEAMLTPSWHKVDYSLPELAARHLGIDACQCRSAGTSL